MGDQNREERDDDRSRPEWAEDVATDSVAWDDRFETEGQTPARGDRADVYPNLGEGQGKTQRQQRTTMLSALQRASELFVGLSNPADSLRTYIADVPALFGNPERIEAEIRVGEEVYSTESFQRTADPMTATARTRTGTAVMITVAHTGERADTGQEPWLATDRELLGAVVTLIKDRIERWEIDSLRHFADGVVALDDDLTVTYVNEQAQQLIGRDSEELRGESILELFPETVDRGADKIRTAIETQSPTSIEGYYSRGEQWIEATIHPGDTGVIVVFHDTSESKVAERQFNHVLETAPVGIVLLNAEGEITNANARAEALLGLSRPKLDRKGYDHPDWEIWDEAGNPIPREEHPVTQVLRTGKTVQGFTHGITLPDGSERWLSSNVAPVTREDAGIEQVIVALEDITMSKRLEQLIETLQPVNEVLNSATTADETKEATCALLTETREYQYARIIDHTPGTTLTESDIQDQSTAVAASESVTLPIQSRAATAPAQIAVETGEIQVVTRNHPDTRFEQWRSATLDKGFEGGAVVPLAHKGRVNGLLILYTDRGEALGSREQTLLTTVGNRIGQVLHALATERILHADTVVELTFESTDPSSFFVSASAQLDCTIEIMDTIWANDEMLVHYASVDGASLDALCDIADRADADTQLRQIRQTEEPPGGDVEIGLQRRSLAQTLVSAGAVVTRATVTSGRAEVVCELPLDSEISSLVTRVQESFPETVFVKKREYKPSLKSETDAVGRVLGDIFENQLTDRQQDVLQAAMYGGYFRSPRESTASELADALSLTQSTVSYHLRNAQQTIFTELFDRLQR